MEQRAKDERNARLLMNTVLRAAGGETDSQLALRRAVEASASAMTRVARGLERMVAMLQDNNDPQSRLVHLERWALDLQKALVAAGIEVPERLR